MNKLLLVTVKVFLFLVTVTCKGPEKKEIAKNDLVKNSNNPDQEYYLQFVEQYGKEFGLQINKTESIAQYVRRIFKDNEDNFWFGTNSLGVVQYDGDSLKYFSTKKGLSGNQVTGIIEDQKGNIWISTNGGVSKYDGTRFINYTIKNGQNTERIWTIFQDSRGIIWVGTANGVFNHDPEKENQFSRFTLSNAGINNPKIRISTIIEDKNGSLWFGTDGEGVIKYTPSDKMGDQFKKFSAKDGLCDNYVMSILQDKKGRIWFGSRYGGISQLTDSKFINFSHTNGDIGDDEVCVVFEDKTGNIWFSSEGFGVYRFDGQTLKNFGVSEGLKIRAVQTIYEDENGLLWIGGGDGLYFFDGTHFARVTRDGPWEKC
ncbi:hypothetical protein OO013_16475 [Mangrovivirga sp. M17]|uniref:Two component regulator with propeller domain n=1 Tax=Mangrovivirga halotolerans TaxID=2993936 RepID=A0ABT3RW81_9BACT|nr:two-component regulator propeller domain-containing protein [Mangrovivirga halotolerans]MCX2745477.1 hypothetical protein [Mangrovivirga halotolerans]